MEVFILMNIGVIAVFYIAFRLMFEKKSSLPGPASLLSLPLIGHSYFLGDEPVKVLLQFRKQYGDVFCLDMGGLRTVFLCSWRVISEAFRSEMVAARPYGNMPAFPVFRSTDSRGNVPGPGMSSGLVWQEQRKFMFHHLNDMLTTGTNMEDVISEEASYLAKKLKQSANQTLSTKNLFHPTTNNIIWRIITGRRTTPDDEELLDLTAKISAFFKSMDHGSLLNLIQLYNVPFLKLCSMLGIPNVMDAVKPMYALFEQEVEGKVADPKGDFVERCLAEIERNKDNPGSSFHGEDGRVHMIGQMFDFFVAGTQPCATFLEWSLLYLCQHEDIQERVHQEIRDIFGVDGSISSRDASRLPFVEATIEEISRHCPQSVLTLPHATVGDYEVGDCVIPKDTQVFAFMTTVHMDEKLFDNPEEFDPSRFIDSNGAFKRDDHVLLFGYGRRRCIGEKLARAESFLLFATLFQKFKFSKVRDLDFHPVPGMIFVPESFDVFVEARK